MFDNIGIFWFRQDLRLNDNFALIELIQKSEKILPIYIYDENIEIGGASKWWLENSLKNLNKSLKSKKSELYTFKGDPKKILQELIKKYRVKNINWNRLYDFYSIERDSKIKKEFIEQKIDIKSFKGSLINEPWNIKNKSGSFFKVFTPYWKTCLEEMSPIKLYDAPIEIKTLNIKSSKILPLNKLNLYPRNSTWTKTLSNNWIAGEHQALISFRNFKNSIIDNYAEGRDRPDKNYTSKLSPHLHFGEISPEKIFVELDKNKKINLESKNKFLAEIGWREFSHSLLFYYPKIRINPIQDKFKNFPWKKNLKYLNAWKEGKTGYPIVDAGMRQLYRTGWMHNRVRMIVGSFLCKNLLIHWWEGEKWFFDTLVDADLASNSAGWQWIAGCGADAAPYFRVFNPVTQGLKFDNKGDYVRKYIPELREVPSNVIHSPWELNEDDQLKYNCLIGKNYPKPIVNLSESRDRALNAFSEIKQLHD